MNFFYVIAKILHELILPVQQRIKDVKEFLNDIDSTLQYDVVPIQDPFGPTKSDPDMDMIIVSSETYRGAEKVNELRVANGLKVLKIHSIPIVDDNNASKSQYKDNKVSSSNKRMDLLGTRINPKQVSKKLFTQLKISKSMLHFTYSIDQIYLIVHILLAWLEE